MEPIKTYNKLPNQRAIAKELDLTEGYVSQLFSGVRKSKKRLEQINKLIEKNMKAA